MKAKPSKLKAEQSPKRYDVLFFGESPGRTESERGFAFVGPAGQLIRSLIEGEIPDCNCWLDNVCPEWLEGGEPNIEKLREYQDYREKQIKKANPQVIVLLGAHALKAFGFTGKGGPTRLNGQVRKYGRAWLVAAVHPAYVLRNPDEVYKYQAVFRAIRTCLEGKTRHADQINKVESVRELKAWLRKTEGKWCGFDLETGGLAEESGRGSLLTAAVACGNEAIWIPLFHPEAWNKTAAELLQVLGEWWSSGPRVVHNLKFECKWMRKLGFRDPAKLRDTMLEAWQFDENEPNNLKHAVVNCLGWKPYWPAVDKAQPDKSQSYASVPLETLGPYNAMDALATLRLDEFFRAGELTQAQLRICDRILTPLAKILTSMETDGVQIDRARLEDVIEKTEKFIARKTRLTEKAFPGVNFNSPKQVSALLFNDPDEGGLGLQPLRVTKTGNGSTDKDTLIALAKTEPRLKHLGEARRAEKFCGRVLRTWLKALDSEDRLHTNFLLGTVVTGRLASIKPNLLNITRAGKEEKFMGGDERTVIVSRFKGGSILQWDYSQHELRTQAAAADCKNLLEALRDPKRDLHQETADEFKTPRSTAKNVNFSVIYDITPSGLEEKYKIPMRLGARLIREWYILNPEVKDYHKVIDKTLRETGRIESFFGWIRHRPDKRQAYNFPIQNAAVLICYLAMIEIQEFIEANGLKSRLILQVHDSIVVDAHPKEVRLLERNVPGLMTGVDYLAFADNRLPTEIPLRVDYKKGSYLA